MAAERGNRRLVSTWRYAPLIHWADNNRKRERSLQREVPEEVYVLVYVEAGQAWLWRDGVREKLALPAAVLQVPGRGPALSVPGASTYLRMGFDVVRVACHYSQKRRLRHTRRKSQPPPEDVWGLSLPAVVPEPLRDSCHAMLSYCAAVWWRGDLDFMNANARLGQWIARLVSHLTHEEGPDADSWIGRSKRTLRRCVDQPTRIAQVAGFLGMSRSHFAARFKAETGRSPSEFLRDLRMEEACRLLATTNHPVSKVAGLCGARSATTFSNEFRKRFGLSPRKWRQRHKGT